MSRAGTGGANRSPNALVGVMGLPAAPLTGVIEPRLWPPAYAPPGPIDGCEKTARVRTNGFSKPTVITRNGRASPRRTGLTLISRYHAVKRANMKATHDDASDRVASQNPSDPELGRSDLDRRFMLRYSDTNVECMRT